jgi:hypothetical protein
MTNRRIMMAGLAAGTASLLSSCGTIIYPDRVNQEERGDLDPMMLGLDAVGLFFFLIPGVIAFAVDFSTGAIYFPEDHEKGDRENTIFDRMDSQVRLDKEGIEKIVAHKTGTHIYLETSEVRVMELQGLDQFWMAYARLSNKPMLAAR